MNIPIRLKPGRERSVLARHLWIFSGAISNLHDIEDGRVHTVVSSRDEVLGIAYFNSRCSIIGRILSFEKISAEEALSKNLLESISLRKKTIPFNPLTMCRLVHGEADLLPGLIVDLYSDVAVIQISTLGMEQLRNSLVAILKETIPLKWIYERSTSSSRKIEGMKSVEGTLWGSERDLVVAEENDISYLIDIKHGQKTGFFLDQREMRSLIRRFSFQRRVLNCFSYSGGFSLAALKGGASFCQSIDVSKSALELLDKNISLNTFKEPPHHLSLCADVFDFLRKEENLPFDLVILDPPAFAKKQHDVPNAIKGYREINSQVLKKMPRGSFLLTCSCSHFISEEHFLCMLKEASLQANRHIRVITGHHNSPDHPISPTHPENEYLKSYFLYVD